MPLSPRQMLVLNRKEKTGYCTTSPKTVNEWNWRTVMHAGEEVIVNTNEKRDSWFEIRPRREDGWENTPRAREFLSRKKKWTPTG
jgi:hypothetical protein